MGSRAFAVVQARADGGLYRGDSDGCDEKWSNSGCILKVELRFPRHPRRSMSIQLEI